MAAPAMLLGRKKIAPSDLRKPLSIAGSAISYIVALFISVESSPEYCSDARYTKSVTMEKGSESMGIL